MYEAKLDAVQIENRLMAAHQGIDNYQRCIDRLADLELALRECIEHCKYTNAGEHITTTAKKALGE